MKFQPQPQQQLTIDHVLSTKEALVFAGMGLGKTASILEVIATLVADGDIRGALIVAPLRVCRLTWPNEQEKFKESFGHLKMVNLHTDEGKHAWHNGGAHMFLINYEYIQSFISKHWHDEAPVQMVVYDECTFAKNPSSKRMKVMRALRSHFSRHVGMTGTPVPNSYLDLFAPMRLIDGGKALGNAVTAFRSRYFTSDYMGWKWTIRDWAAGKIEEKIAHLVVTLRSEDWIDLPPVETKDVYIKVDAETERRYKTLQKTLLLEIRNKRVEASSAGVLVNKLLQFTGGAAYDANGDTVPVHHAKIEALDKLVQDIGEPVLIAAHYKHEYDRILKMVPGSEMFDEKRLDAWNAGKIKAWVAHSKSIGYGLNLQEGSCNIIWYGPTYSRADYDQFNARLVRQGQTRPTTIWRLLFPNSIDEAVVEVLRNKGDVQGALMQTLSNLKKLAA